MHFMFFQFCQLLKYDVYILNLKQNLSVIILLHVYSIYSRRRSGFDMAPPVAAMLPTAAVPGLS